MEKGIRVELIFDEKSGMDFVKNEIPKLKKKYLPKWVFTSELDIYNSKR